MKKSISISAALLVFCLLLSACSFSQGTAINSTGARADSSAMLDASSTTQGFLLPRMTTSQRNAINSPAQSLLIFNTTTTCFEYHYSGVWYSLSCTCTVPQSPVATSATDITVSSFSANWNAASGASSYYLDVSTSSSFSDFVSGYNNLDAGSGTTYSVTGLACNITYYYRIRAVNNCGTSANSNIISAITSSCCAGSGSFDLTFGTNGVITENPSSSTDWIYRMAIDATGLYSVGSDFIQGNAEIRVEKRNLSTGALIWSQTNNPTVNSDVAYDVACDASGLYVGGCENTNAESRWHLEKRDLSTGNLITSFGTNGVVTSDPSSGGDIIQCIAVDSSGIYVVGSYMNTYWDWRIEKRDLNTGALITSFGTNGVVVSNIPSDGYAFDIDLDTSGIYIVGDDRIPGKSEWRIEKRDLTTGALISAFGTGGIIMEDPSTGYNQAQAIAIDTSGIYVTGYDHSLGNTGWRTEKRNLTSGALITSFGTNGVILENISSGTDVPNGIAVDNSGLYITGYDNSPGNAEWRIEKRNQTTGSLIWSQGSNPSSGSDYEWGAITLDATSVYNAGVDYTPGNYEWRFEKRCK